MAIRVLLVDDHEILLEGLSALLAGEAGIEVVGLARDGKEAVELAAELRPQAVIMDLALPGMNGIEATRRILASAPETRVLCLSMHAEKEFVIAALEAGASGYVLKEEPLHTVVEGIRTLAAGRDFLCEGVSTAVLQAFRASASERGSPSDDPLTDRERQVLRLLATGRSTRGIAEALKVSPKTIGAHKDNIRAKLGIRSIAGLTKYAIRRGLTTAGRDPERS